jgi:hypothetical protein
MSAPFDAQCDDFHVATRLFLKLDLTLQRETVLHFFDSVKREIPTMRKLRRREDGSLLLEEGNGEDGSRRWLRLDEATIRLGYHNPAQTIDAQKLGEVVLKMAPYHLTLGDLDYDHLEVVYGFDLDYQGNHDQLVADTLFGDGALAGLLNHGSVTHAIDVQPFLGVSVSEACETQVYVEIKSHTSAYEIRTQQYDTQQLGVFLTVRKYWGITDIESLIQAHHELTAIAEEWAAERVVPLVVNPLAHAIASGS